MQHIPAISHKISMFQHSPPNGEFTAPNFAVFEVNFPTTKKMSDRLKFREKQEKQDT